MYHHFTTHLTVLVRIVMTALDSYAGNSTLGTEGILFLADIALAVGAKLEVAATSLHTRL